MTYTPVQAAYLTALTTPEDIMAVMQAERAVDAEHAATEARLNAPGALLNAALWYASQGLLVFPCKPLGKEPITSHGFKDATTDLDQIRTWWHRWPNANVSLPTGHQFDVLDIDGPEGHVSLAELRMQGLLEEPTLAVASTPRGHHLYYTPSGDGNTTALAPGIDYRGRGGYVLAAPSHVEPPQVKVGGVYRWSEPLNLGATA